MWSDKAVSPVVGTPAVADASGWALDVGMRLNDGILALGHLAFRLVITKGQNAQYALISSLSLYDANGEFSPTNMTSDSTGGFVASVSTEYGAGYKAFKAFDGNSATYWLSLINGIPGWLKLACPSRRVLSKYKIYCLDNWYPLSWRLEGSHTGAFAGEEVVLDTVTDYVWTAGGQEHIIL
jgi:hypothetical protein